MTEKSHNTNKEEPQTTPQHTILEYDRLRSELNQCNAERNKLQGEVENLRADKIALINVLGSGFEELRNELHKLKEEIESLDKKNSKLEENNQELMKHNNALMVRVSKLKEELEEAHMSIIVKENEIDNLQAKMDLTTFADTQDIIRSHQNEMNHGTNKTIILGVDDFATLTGLTLEPSLEIINLVKTMNIEWKHVIQCIRHEMSPLISTSLEAALTSLVFGNADSPKMKDLSATFVDRVLNAMAQSLTLSNKEATYIKFAVQRAIKYGEIHENKEGTAPSKSTEITSFAPKGCSGLDSDLLFDIFCVKKAHKFSFEQMTDYTHSDYIHDVEAAERDTILGDIGITKFVNEQEFKKNVDYVSLYPSWLIDDDMFDVMQWAFACSHFADHLQKLNQKETDEINIKMRIIPQSLVSLYDSDKRRELTGIGLIEEFINNSGVRSCALQTVSLGSKLSVDVTSKLIQIHYDNIMWQRPSELQQDFVVLIDRRKHANGDTKGHEKLWIFQCSDKKALDILDRNYLFGFDFEIGGVVKTWCRFGEYQRIRFFPEYITSLIPRLFVAPEMSPMEYMMKIYDSDFKHQWRVSLDDPTFNLYYKAITGDDHISNNYYRERVTVDSYDHVEQTLGFWEYLHRRTDQRHFDVIYRWHIEQDMDSDAIFDDLIETDEAGQPLHIDDNDSNFAQWLKQEHIAGGAAFVSLKKAVMKWKKMECGSTRKKKLELTDCYHFDVILHYLRAFQQSGQEVSTSNLVRFNLGEITESIDHLISVHQILNPEQRAEIHRCVARRLECNATDQCHIVNKSNIRVRERTGKDETHAIALDPMDRECETLNSALYFVHNLLLHRDQVRGRESNDRFSTEMVEMKDSEKKEDERTGRKFPSGIDFGESVLRWIPFGELPYFRSLRDEIVNNKDSTIDEELFEQYLIECIAMLKGTTYSLREILALKLYTDTTAFQAILRKAFWTTSPLSMKKTFYFWASALYQASLYHSVPIPSVNGKSPQPLYHGLNRLLTVGDEHPKYQGPFSVSTLRTVAHRFSNETGLYFRIRPSYSNPLKRCLGLNMETISCFKDEREILLVDQYIPVRSTKTFQNKATTLVDLLIFTVKGRKTEIKDIDLFFQKLGICFDPEWMPLITEHSELFELSAFGGRLVIARLYMELNIWCDEWVPLKVNKENADKELLIYSVEQRQDERLLPLYTVLMSKIEVFQSHSLEVCWKVSFQRFNAMNYIGTARTLKHTDQCIAKSQYRINDSLTWCNHGWWRSWSKDSIIHRIQCRNTALFGDQVVWEEMWNVFKDAEPRDFIDQERAFMQFSGRLERSLSISSFDSCRTPLRMLDDKVSWHSEVSALRDSVVPPSPRGLYGIPGHQPRSKMAFPSPLASFHGIEPSFMSGINTDALMQRLPSENGYEQEEWMEELAQENHELKEKLTEAKQEIAILKGQFDIKDDSDIDASDNDTDRNTETDSGAGRGNETDSDSNNSSGVNAIVDSDDTDSDDPDSDSDTDTESESQWNDMEFEDVRIPLLEGNGVGNRPQRQVQRRRHRWMKEDDQSCVCLGYGVM